MIEERYVRVKQPIDSGSRKMLVRPLQNNSHGATTTSQSLPKGRTFTLADYADMVGRFQEQQYQFISFPETKVQLEAGQSFVLMRHDIDMSLEAALRMARLEADLGAQSTYFFMLRTDHYNVFSKDGSDAVSQILAWGHNLGLHFDCASYPAGLSARDLARACAREVAMLESWFNQRVSVVSYHRPDAKVLKGDPALSAPLPHTYMELFRNRIRYVSDSGGRWANAPPTATVEFDHGLPLHILVHPVWWTEQPTSAYETLLQLVDQKTDSLERSIARNCKVFSIGHLSKEAERSILRRISPNESGGREMQAHDEGFGPWSAA